MKISARNQLLGTVKFEVDAGAIVAAITRGSVESLELKAGDKVKVVMESTEVMTAK